MFVLEKEMSIFLVEVERADVLDEDLVLEFVTHEEGSWKATMDNSARESIDRVDH